LVFQRNRIELERMQNKTRTTNTTSERPMSVGQPERRFSNSEVGRILISPRGNTTENNVRRATETVRINSAHKRKINYAPYPGLVNLGNTCYLNGALQILFYCPYFRENLRQLVSENFQCLPEQFVKRLSNNTRSKKKKKRRSTTIFRR